MNIAKVVEKDGKKFNLRDIVFTTLFTVSFIIQIILMFLFSNELGIIILVYIGYIIWGFSLYFGLITFWTFKKKGGVEKGKSYVYTTKLVENGPYAIVRHPQYLGGMLFSISITFWTQIFLSLFLSIIIIILTYQWTYVEDKNLIEKFGEDYKKYKLKVPRLNPILGTIRYFIRRKRD
ncbi:MAG: methyltransferase family protein [Promethearchaeota archaeon]